MYEFVKNKIFKINAANYYFRFLISFCRYTIKLYGRRSLWESISVFNCYTKFTPATGIL